MSAERDDEFVLSDPIEPPREHLHELIRNAQQQAASEKASLPPPPQWPLVSGVFAFPCYRDTLGVWLGMSFGLTLVWLGFCVLLGPAMAMGLMAVRALAPAVGMVTVLAFSYVATCCMHIVRETCKGQDVIDDWPTGDWREWGWALLSVGYVAAVCGLVAQALRIMMAPLVDTWLPGVCAGLLLFPFLLVSSLDANSFWLPFSKMVLRSLTSVWTHWLVFYGVFAILIGGWLLAALLGIWFSPWLCGLLLGPALASILLVAARLFGRVAWWAIQRAREEDDEQGDH